MVEVINRGRPTNPTLVLLPGLGLGPDLWEPHLDELTQNFRVVAPELPGFGSFSGRGPFRFDDAASFVADLIGDDRGAAFVCGFSLGAMVALQLAVDHPERLRGLVLASGTAKPNRVAYRLQTAAMHALPTRRLARPGYPRTALMAGWRELGRADFRPVLRQITLPTLVLCGARDYPGVRAGRTLFTAIRTASLQVIPQVGRRVTDSPAFPSLVTRFLTSIPD